MASAAMARANTVKFGAPLALSCSPVMIGQTAQQGLQMAVDEINAQDARPHHK
jgi:ABC-type branched-subunit amino acid transport system substrate-binding protein